MRRNKFSKYTSDVGNQSIGVGYGHVTAQL